MDITLCLIVKDEEEKLAICLESFSRLYSHLIVVDTGSSDATKSIAKQFGAQIYDFVWIDDFSAARNFALDQVQTSWVMVVDADDIIEDAAKKILLAELKDVKPETKGICLPYIYSGNASKKGFTTYIPRLWRTNLKYRYILSVHEYLNIPKSDLKDFLRLSSPVIHNKKTADFAKSLTRNLTILEKSHKKDPSQSRILFYLGRDNKSSGNYQKAIYWYKKFVRLINISPDELNRAYLGMGDCYQALGKLKLAQQAYLQSIKANPNFIEGYLQLGDFALQNKKYKSAARFYLEATKKTPPQTHVFLNMQLYNGIARTKVCEAIQHLKDFQL